MRIVKAAKEYLQLVKDGIKNRDQIIEAIRTASELKKGNKDHKITDEAIAEIMRRKDICAGCPFQSENAKRERGYESDIPFIHCTLCKCRIGYDNSKEYCLPCVCGIQVWNNNNPDKPPRELKWDAFVQPETDKTTKDE